MNACIPLRFGIGNHVADALLAADPLPVAQTPLDRLKTEWRSRTVIWESAGRDIVIEGQMPDARVADFLAIPNSSLVGLDEVRFDLFSEENFTSLAYTTGFTRLAEPPALPFFSAGIDPYGVPVDGDKPAVFTQWLPTSIVFRSFRLVIRQSELVDGADLISLRMLVIGTKLQLENNFMHGGQLSYLTPPKLKRTASGSNIPTAPQRYSRTATFDLSMMSEKDRKALSSMEVSLRGQAFLVSAYTGREGWEANDHAFIARFLDRISYSHTNEGIYSSDPVVVEV